VRLTESLRHPAHGDPMDLDRVGSWQCRSPTRDPAFLLTSSSSSSTPFYHTHDKRSARVQASGSPVYGFGPAVW
jgi:hypothetical protein